MRIRFGGFILLLIYFANGLGQQITTNPHGDKLKISCETCHNTDDWNKIPGWKFNHDQTGFVLFGAHNKIQCRDCHESLVFSNIGVSCIDCHIDIHKGELGNQCENCHNSQTWENRSSVYKQHNQTNFPLIGVHANIDCESCHKNEQGSQYAAISIECQSCHLKDFMSTINPSHQQANFDLDCQKCHQVVTSQWKSAVFTHTPTFLLKGGHKSIECIACHNTGYRNTSVECMGCHQSDYKATVDPSHSTFGFPTVCEKCHDEFSWSNAEFDHFVESNFRIEGAHKYILCTDCHINNQLSGLSRECSGCHLQEYNNVSEPPHSQNNFSFECLDCHTMETWSPAMFDHASTGFPLSDAHIKVNCKDCHTTGYVQPLPTDCYSCHQQDFAQVSDPNHVTNNFDHNCLVCHSDNVWSPASFNHNSTDFPLVGAHTQVNCAQCHSNGYQNTPLLCVACHQSDYDNTTSPKHSSAQFPTTCEDCHTANRWDQVNWDHDNQYFPIYSGSHREEWNICADCHVNPQNYVQFECINCHSKSKMDEEHRERNDYVYESQACYNCHPNGKAD